MSDDSADGILDRSQQEGLRGAALLLSIPKLRSRCTDIKATLPRGHTDGASSRASKKWETCQISVFTSFSARILVRVATSVNNVLESCREQSVILERFCVFSPPFDRSRFAVRSQTLRSHAPMGFLGWQAASSASRATTDECKFPPVSASIASLSRCWVSHWRWNLAALQRACS